MNMKRLERKVLVGPIIRIWEKIKEYIPRKTELEYLNPDRLTGQDRINLLKLREDLNRKKYRLTQNHIHDESETAPEEYLGSN